MKPLLVHIHIFYEEMWEELAYCLNSIEQEYVLYVTLVEESPDLENRIIIIKPDAVIEITENLGYDIYPFIYIINKINLDNYSYIVKLHTKRDAPPCHINNYNFCGAEWRNELLTFVKTKENFKKSIQLLENKDIGMIANYKLIALCQDSRVAYKKFTNFCTKNDLPQIKFKFVAGTMFIAKAEIFKNLQGKFRKDDFMPATVEREFSFAHIIERYLGYLVYYNKKKIFLSKKELIILFFKRNIIPIFYQDQVNQKRERVVRIFRIPIYRKKLSNTAC